ncbi:MAG: FAD-binding oxidoreductase [Clostridiales Family XIII bacterium]|jgi:FAD/FMN-containing dehydrogenase|nr:FAD-binding oxidoreductase [Clostridiales Family XIII bacterium]
MLLSGWGHYPKIDTVKNVPSTINKTLEQLQISQELIPRGFGRAYGDSALNDKLIISSLKLDSMISFDNHTGELETESGVTLEDILDTFAPRGWFLPVTPGTKFVTIGGAVASDVHGKNHHVAGSFGSHVSWFDIWTSSKGLVRCNSSQNSDLYYSTIGGHGLTGFITRVCLKLIKIPSVYICQTLIKAENLEEIMDLFEAYDKLPYSVAWIDCQSKGKYFGRSLFMGGYFAEDELSKKEKTNPYLYDKHMNLFVPFNFPSFVLNSYTIKAFNALYYHKNLKKKKQSIVTYDKFFYPLDSINNWNRIYGKKGFLQYQFALPMETSKIGISSILNKIIDIGTGSFLAVLKLFGDQPKFEGNISFPQKGFTLALDFPVNKNIFDKLNELDKLVLDYGGRLYLTKDSRTTSEVFYKSYEDQILHFLDTKFRWDERGVFSSLQSKRLKLTK